MDSFMVIAIVFAAIFSMLNVINWKSSSYIVPSNINPSVIAIELLSLVQNKIKLSWLAVLLCALCPNAVRGAELSAYVISDVLEVNIDGPINRGDYDRLRKLLASEITLQPINRIMWIINSEGGDVVEAMKMGRLARELLVKVVVPGALFSDPDSKDGRYIANYIRENPGDRLFYRHMLLRRDAKLTSDMLRKCYSACVMIFYGAPIRDSGSNVDKRFLPEQKYPVFGLHRPYFDKQAFASLSPSEARQEYLALERATRAYLEEMGATRALIERMFNSSSNEIDLVGYDEMSKYYRETEPFVDEWLIAKCADAGSEYELSETELKINQEVLDARAKKSRKTDNDDEAVDILSNYVPPEYDKSEVLRIDQKRELRNRLRYSCKAIALQQNMFEWARSYAKLSSDDR